MRKQDYKNRIKIAIMLVIVILLAINLIILEVISMGGEKPIYYWIFGGIILLIYVVLFAYIKDQEKKMQKADGGYLENKDGKLNGLPPAVTTLLMDIPELKNIDIPILAGMISKGYIQVTDTGKVEMISQSFWGWLEHERAIYKKYTEASNTEIKNLNEMLKRDANHLGIIEMSANKKAFKISSIALVISVMIFLATLLHIFNLYLRGIEVDDNPWNFIMIVFSFVTTVGLYCLTIGYAGCGDTEYNMTREGYKYYKDMVDLKYNLYEYSINAQNLIKDEEFYIDIIPYAFVLGKEQIIMDRINLSPKYKNLMKLK